MLLEVCAFSVADCVAAEQAGANRIELCMARTEGGLTPSLGLIEQARRATQVPLFVMIRPRGGDFVYTADELTVMEADIDVARRAGADGIVLGVLQPNGQVDKAVTGWLVERAGTLPVTFHRAFDLTADPAEALDTLIELGIRTVLTSGQQRRAIDALPLLAQLARQSAGRIDVMAGSGVNATNAAQLAQTGVAALHLSGSVATESPMQFRRDDVPMASTIPGEYERIQSSEAAIRAVRAALTR